MLLHFPHLSAPYAGRHRADWAAPISATEREDIHRRIADAIEQRAMVLMDPPAGRPYLDPAAAMPCMNTWTPRTCHFRTTDPATRQRSPIDHTCWTPRTIPHVCTCIRCGHPR